MRQVFNHGCLVLCASYRPQAKHTVFRCLSAAWGRTLCAHRGNRIGGHKNRSFLYGTVRPRVISECGNRTTQGLLLLKHALIRERSELRWALHPALFSTPDWGNSRAWLFWSRLRTVYHQSLWCRRQSMHVFASSAGAWLYAEVQQSDQELERALGLIHSTDRSGST